MGSGRTVQQDKQERQSERAERFWSAFRFTENGKPKSSLIVYTFSLSLVYAAVYFFCYEGAIHLLTDLVSALPPWAGNAVIAFTASAAGAAVCCLPHRFFRDKRLVSGAHLWLCLYALAVLVTMLILLGFTGAFTSFLTFFAWFLLPPTALGTILSALLYRRVREKASPVKEPEPEWKKYTERR
ncbi:MAG: hypothetical protein J5859_02345 [Clostridia bacterium]|nr:hypothetical protein [Clostridia bacterium]